MSSSDDEGNCTSVWIEFLMRDNRDTIEQKQIISLVNKHLSPHMLSNFGYIVVDTCDSKSSKVVDGLVQGWSCFFTIVYDINTQSPREIKPDTIREFCRKALSDLSLERTWTIYK